MLGNSGPALRASKLLVRLTRAFFSNEHRWGEEGRRPSYVTGSRRQGGCACAANRSPQLYILFVACFTSLMKIIGDVIVTSL